MQGRPAARRELEDLLRTRRRLYALADETVDTSALGIERSAERIVEIATED